MRATSAGSASLKIRMRSGDVNVPSFPVVVAPVTTIGIHAMIICEDNKCPVTEERIEEMISSANEIYEQVCIQFYLASLTVTNLPSAYNILPSSVTNNIGDVWSHSRLAGLMSNTGGIECYFVNGIVNNHGEITSIRGLTSNSGVVIARQGNLITLAHEIGHLCGADDIYDSDQESSDMVSEYVSYEHTLSDWNGGCAGHGASGARYYPHGQKLCFLIPKLLMYGYGSENKRDITFGDVYGLGSAGILGLDDSPLEPGGVSIGFKSGANFSQPVCQ